MGAFAEFCRIVRGSAVRVGQRVNLVQWDGCMAHIRGRVQTGKVLQITSEKVYGDHKYRPYVLIQLEDGTQTKRVAERNYWFERDGVMEYDV